MLFIKRNKWMPAAKLLPSTYKKEGEFYSPVIVTYLSYHEQKPQVDGLAIYDEKGEVWRWYNENVDDINEMEQVIVTITAWRSMPTPYKGK